MFWLPTDAFISKWPGYKHYCMNTVRQTDLSREIKVRHEQKGGKYTSTDSIIVMQSTAQEAKSRAYLIQQVPVALQRGNSVSARDH